MIKIIKGTYGYVGDNGIPVPKTSKSEPFSVNPDEEQRLIDLGVAEHVDDVKPVAEKKAEVKAEPKKEQKKPANKKSGTKKKTSNKKEAAQEEPPAFDAVDPE